MFYLRQALAPQGLTVVLLSEKVALMCKRTLLNIALTEGLAAHSRISSLVTLRISSQYRNALVILSQVAFSMSAQTAPLTLEACAASTSPLICIAFLDRAVQMAKYANTDSEAWAKVADLGNEELAAPYQMLADHSVLHIYSGKITTLSPYSRPTKRLKNRVEAEEDSWRAYVKVIRAINADGRIAFDTFPCLMTCEGHRRGFEWATENRVISEAGCRGESRSFDEGCLVAVRRRVQARLEDPDETK